MPLAYAPGVDGAAVLRIRESYVRDWLAPALSARAEGVAKLDLALRAIASAGPEPVTGVISPDISWEQLHDLVRRGDFYGDSRTLKRNWVSDKLGFSSATNSSSGHSGREVGPSSSSSTIGATVHRSTAPMAPRATPT
jgi:hypothetical protein